MTRIALIDSGDLTMTDVVVDVIEGVLEEAGYPTEQVDYLNGVPKNLTTHYDIVVAMGSDAVKATCNTDKTVDKYAGSLTWNEKWGVWVLPTHHPNRIHQERYDLFDITYSHLRRAVDLVTGRQEFPPVGGHTVDWEFVGHNGIRQDDNLWTGYDECTQDELRRMVAVLDGWLYELDNTGSPILFAADTESWTTDHFYPLTMVQIYDGQYAYAFNWGVIAGALDQWREFFSHPNARFVWHNGKHDSKMIHHWMGVPFFDDRHDDTMCWSLGLTEKGNQTGLKYLSRQWCNAPFYEEALDEWLDKSNINYGHIRPDVLAEYGSYDVYYTYQLARILPEMARREGTEHLVTDILLPAQRTFAELEYEGIRVDTEYASELSREWVPKIEAAIRIVQNYALSVGFPQDVSYTRNQICRDFCACVPVHLREALASVRCTSYGKTLREVHGFNEPCDTCGNKRYVKWVDNTLNVHSNAQMQHLAFDVLGMPETYEGRKTNRYFWDMNEGHEFTKLVKQYRELDYLHRNIIQGFGSFVRADGRVHPDFLLFGTTTGRLAVRNPAMQTVPSRSANAKFVKRLFLPDPGDLIVNVDYSNLELYMAHHLTGDPDLLEALQADMHLTTAAAMYMKTCEEVTAIERQSAKPVNFGAGYNIKAKKLSRNKDLINITNGEESVAQTFLDAFWGKYQTWAVAKEEWKREALENCELTTELGRKRRWSLITADNSWKVENQATNFKGQSMASDLCLTSLIQLQKLLKERGWGRIILTVHDSLVASIHRQYLHEAVALMEKIMTTPIFETQTPFKVDVQVGPNYGDVSSYDPSKDYTS